MKISQEIISQDDCFPTDDNGNSWTTGEEWFSLAVNEDYTSGEYTKGEWRQLCNHFADEARYMMGLILKGE